MCAPPTVLKNGDFYSVLGEVEPIDLPEWLVEIFTAPGRDKQPEPGATRQETAYKAPYKAPETIPAGSRNDTLYRTACSLAAKGMGDSAVLAAVLAENKTKCSSPLDDAEIQTLVHSACVFNRQHPPTSQPMPLRDPPIRKAQVPSTEDHPYDFNLIATRLRDKFNVISFKKTLFRYKDGIYVEDEGYLDSCIVTELLQSGIGQRRAGHNGIATGPALSDIRESRAGVSVQSCHRCSPGPERYPKDRLHNRGDNPAPLLTGISVQLQAGSCI